jgi:hypothetical protein
MLSEATPFAPATTGLLECPGAETTPQRALSSDIVSLLARSLEGHRPAGGVSNVPRYLPGGSTYPQIARIIPTSRLREELHPTHAEHRTCGWERQSCRLQSERENSDASQTSHRTRGDRSGLDGSIGDHARIRFPRLLGLSDVLLLSLPLKRFRTAPSGPTPEARAHRRRPRPCCISSVSHSPLL